MATLVTTVKMHRSLMPLCLVTPRCRLKTVEMVIRNTQGAEGVLKQYEDCLHEVHTVPRDVKEVETYRAKLKVSCVSFYCMSGFRNATSVCTSPAVHVKRKHILFPSCLIAEWRLRLCDIGRKCEPRLRGNSPCLTLWKKS